jgi:hypothetical protein
MFLSMVGVHLLRRAVLAAGQAGQAGVSTIPDGLGCRILGC